jgi:rubrerythrin
MGFSDRINDTLRGAKTALEVAEVRQRLVESELERDRLLAALGAAVYTAYTEAGQGEIDPRFAHACQEVEAATDAVTDLRSQVGAIMASRAVGPAARFCRSCGAQMNETGAFCPSCGAPSA